MNREIKTKIIMPVCCIISAPPPAIGPSNAKNKEVVTQLNNAYPGWGVVITKEANNDVCYLKANGPSVPTIAEFQNAISKAYAGVNWVYNAYDCDAKGE